MLRGGWPVIFIGMASLLAALGYSGGPFPLASHGLGDLFVFIFFGWVAVCGTYYVQALQLTWIVFFMASAVGLPITAILVINNLRDLHTDQKVGKNTLAVILGENRSKIEYAFLLALAYGLLLIIWLIGQASFWILLPLLSLPWAFSLIRTVLKSNIDPGLNIMLAKTAGLSLIYSVLLSIGSMMSF
jgi:1,4-dihydroxy-2-naphthoate octaprenyltransferase